MYTFLQKTFGEKNIRIFILVFKIFWICIFLLDSLSETSVEIPQFIYVNF